MRGRESKKDDRNTVAQNTSPTENRMNPSVTGTVEDPSTDSMFNNADPQTSELLKKSTAKDRASGKAQVARRRKTA